MSGLSDEDRDLLVAELLSRVRPGGTSMAAVADGILTAVEAIAARHAAAAVEAALAPIVALRDEWDDEARQAWVVADSIGSGDIIADQRSRHAERLRAALDLGATR